MAINLSNVNVSIQQFQAVASGEVNAGEVKLTSETTLGKVNNLEVGRLAADAGDARRIDLGDLRTALRRRLNNYCLFTTANRHIVETAASLGLQLTANCGEAIYKRYPALAALSTVVEG